VKDSTATINYEEHNYKIKAANPQQLSTTVGVLGRLIGLAKEFRKVVDPVPNSIVDIGANVGAYSIMFNYCFPHAKILAIEPSTNCMPYITYNCANIPEIEIRQFAVGSEQSQGMLAIPTSDQRVMHNDYHDTHTGCLSLYGKSNNLREEVDIFPLDELDVERPVGLIKIDTEGNELEVLKGAKKIIEEDQPVMLIEVHEPNLNMAGVTKRQLYRLLAGMGYFPLWQYGKDFLFYPKGIDYFLDKLDYKFMEGVDSWRV
jgi:FkbM family methyltransferase